MSAQSEDCYKPVTPATLPFSFNAATLEGLVHGVFGNALVGWVWDTAQPEKVVAVEVFSPDGFYTQIAADGFQAELQTAGKRNGHCAIILPLPEKLLQSGPSLVVVVAGTLHVLKPVGGPDQHVFENWMAQHDKLLRQLLVHRIHWELTGQGASKEDLESELAQIDPDAMVGLNTLVQQVLRKQPVFAAPRKVSYADDLVRSAYLGVLKREPEPRAYEHYSNAMRNGLTLQDLISELMTTAGCQDSVIVSDKTTPKSEMAQALQEAASVMSGLMQRLEQVQQAFIRPEIVELTVKEIVMGVYQGCLKREPEPRAYEIYGNAIRNGLTLQEFITDIVKEPEFLTSSGLVPASAQIGFTELRQLSGSMERAVLTLAMEAASMSLENKGHARSAPQQHTKAAIEAKTSSLKGRKATALTTSRNRAI